MLQDAPDALRPLPSPQPPNSRLAGDPARPTVNPRATHTGREANRERASPAGRALRAYAWEQAPPIRAWLGWSRSAPRRLLVSSPPHRQPPRDRARAASATASCRSSIAPLATAGARRSRRAGVIRRAVYSDGDDVVLACSTTNRAVDWKTHARKRTRHFAGRRLFGAVRPTTGRPARASLLYPSGAACHRQPTVAAALARLDEDVRPRSWWGLGTNDPLNTWEKWVYRVSFVVLARSDRRRAGDRGPTERAHGCVWPDPLRDLIAGIASGWSRS